jgi:hypothetical protein
MLNADAFGLFFHTRGRPLAFIGNRCAAPDELLTLV